MALKLCAALRYVPKMIIYAWIVIIYYEQLSARNIKSNWADIFIYVHSALIIFKVSVL